MRRIIFLLLSIAIVTSIAAAPRDKEAMKAAALEVLGNHSSVRHAVRHGSISVLESNESFTVMGYVDGGFAVIANDDALPAVIGYSDAVFSTSGNDNFRWYLDAVETAIKNILANNSPYKASKPDPAKYPASTSPFVTSQWGQEAPFNNLCPIGTASGTGGWQGYSGTGRSVTGCIATAMAQIIYYNRYPEHGFGKNSVSVKQADKSELTVTVDFSKSVYDYNNMIDVYVAGKYNPAQSNAVARLMLDCGVAAQMSYATDASGAMAPNACRGLVKYFGYPSSTHIMVRANYHETAWMDSIYEELSNHRAILYCGTDTKNGGHAFVFDGYEDDGLVHVNWGWDGSNNGYYDVSLLNPRELNFTTGQQMIVGFAPPVVKNMGDTVTVKVAGTLGQLVPDSLVGELTALKVSGSINSSDLGQIRKLAGRDSMGNPTRGILRTLDLREARIVSGGEPFLVSGTSSLTTSDDILPERAFQDCRTLQSIALPEGITGIGDGALSGLLNVNSVYIPSGAGKDYIVNDNVIYNKDTTELIGVLPMKTGESVISGNVAEIHKYAFYGNSGVNSIIIPATVRTIGEYAFADMQGLGKIKVCSETPPELGLHAFSGNALSDCYLYVPAGTKERYKRTALWSSFVQESGDDAFDNIIEFGTKFKVRNAMRKYGEQNPAFRWQISGDYVDGTPEISCTAVPASPVGRYDILISRGTVTATDVNFESGYLIIQKNTARLKADSADVIVGTLQPVFTYTVDSLQNGETSIDTMITEPSFKVMDSMGNTVTSFDVPGETYQLVPFGAESRNYDFVYVPAVVRVVPDATTGIETVTKDMAGNADKVYNLAGQQVDKSYRGIVIVNGHKFIRK